MERESLYQVCTWSEFAGKEPEKPAQNFLQLPLTLRPALIHCDLSPFTSHTDLSAWSAECWTLMQKAARF